ncbi:MAG: hypothetical protein P1U86_21750, partial [Verrucomicrobiales bacterium]|nr:hypothetical protein [Verrucomicrobiales bacterium]
MNGISECCREGHRTARLIEDCVADRYCRAIVIYDRAGSAIGDVDRSNRCRCRSETTQREGEVLVSFDDIIVLKSYRE